MSDSPERIWITGYESDPTSRWWSEKPVLWRVEYVRADLALPAVQPDAAAIREIAEGLLSLGDNLTYIAAATDANLHRDAYSLRADALALINNPGKEVRSSTSVNGQTDTAPAGLSAGGGAPPAWPEGLIHLTGDISRLRCTIEGCERRVSTRFEGSDYCEPCGRSLATGKCW